MIFVIMHFYVSVVVIAIVVSTGMVTMLRPGFMC
jgi:hypothetical protein